MKVVYGDRDNLSTTTHTLYSSLRSSHSHTHTTLHTPFTVHPEPSSVRPMFKRLAKKREREEEDEASGMKEIKEILGMGGEDEISGESDSESDDDDNDSSDDDEDEDDDGEGASGDDDEGELEFLPASSSLP